MKQENYAEVVSQIIAQRDNAQELVDITYSSMGVELDVATLLDDLATLGLLLVPLNKEQHSENYASLAYFRELGMDIDTMLDQLGYLVP